MTVVEPLPRISKWEAPLQNLAECKVLQRSRCRTMPNARFCNRAVAEPCQTQGSATEPLQNLAKCKVLQRSRCRTLPNARFCNGSFIELSENKFVSQRSLRYTPLETHATPSWRPGVRNIFGAAQHTILSRTPA